MPSSSSPVQRERSDFQAPLFDALPPPYKNFPQNDLSSIASAGERNEGTGSGFCSLCLWVLSPFARLFRWIRDRVCGSSDIEVSSGAAVAEAPSQFSELQRPLLRIFFAPSFHFFRDIVPSLPYTQEEPFRCKLDGKQVVVWVAETSSNRSLAIQSREYWELGPDSRQAHCQKWEIFCSLLTGEISYSYENELPVSKDRIKGSGNVFMKKDRFFMSTVFHLLQVGYYCNVLGISPIKENFTLETPYEEQLAAHQRAKVFLTEKLLEIGGEFECIAARPKREGDAELLKKGPLSIQIDPDLIDHEIFTCQTTYGVLEDILAAGKPSEEDDSIYAFSAASQFNGTEAVTPETPIPGSAEVTYVSDRTQGPQAQLAFLSEVIEAILCAANLGFSSIIPALDEETKSEVFHGYLMPHATKAARLLQRLVERGHLIEYPCIGSPPKEGSRNVYEILVSAPAMGYKAEIVTHGCDLKDQELGDKIEYVCALNAFRAQFAQGIALAQKYERPVKLKLAAVGLGVFDNNPENVAKALFQAAQEYQKELKHHNVRCQFQIFKGTDANARRVADLLSLKEFIG